MGRPKTPRSHAADAKSAYPRLKQQRNENADAATKDPTVSCIHGDGEPTDTITIEGNKFTIHHKTIKDRGKAAKFTYNDKLAPQNFRLLTPCESADDPMAFRLSRIPRKGAKYAAISYIWGDEEPTETIIINGKEFTIRPNLWNCLYFVRRQCWRKGDGPKSLWVDAICINQDDTAEKSEQVREMESIYREAVEVCTWLGDELDMSSSGCRARVQTDYQFFESKIEELADHPYWTRCWVIQEFLSGRQVWICCGGRRIEWDLFERILRTTMSSSIDSESSDTPAALPLIMAKRRFEDPTKNPSEDLWYTRESRGKYRKHPAVRISLYHLLVSHRHAICKDPRDKVFSLLGLSANVDRSCIGHFPDYSIGRDEVVILTLAHLISDLLSKTDHPPERVDTESDMIDIFYSLGVGNLPDSERLDLLTQAYNHIGHEYWPSFEGDLVLEWLGISHSMELALRERLMSTSR